MSRSRLARPEVAFVLLVLAALGLGPLVLGRGTVGIFVNFLIVVYFACSWNLVGGVLGELNLAHVVPWGIGGYAVALAADAGIPLAVALVAAVALGAVASAIVVLLSVALRLEGLYLAVFTLVVAEVVLAGVRMSTALGSNIGLRLSEDVRHPIGTYHAVGLALVVLVLAVTWLVLRAPTGLRWLALRDDAAAAGAVGVAVRTEKVLAYALAGGLAAVGGAYHAHVLGFATPASLLSLAFMVVGVLCVFSGGPGTVLGPVIGALLIEGLASAVNVTATDPSVAIASRLAQYALAIVLIRTIIARSGGDDLLTAVLKRWRRPRPAATDELRVAAEIDVVRPTRTERAPGDEVLRVDGLAKSFGGLHVLRGVSFTLHEGEFAALVGPNGAGKTTVTNIVTGFLRPDAGELIYRGRALAGLAPHERFAAGIARTFQTPRLFPRLTLLENTAVACGGDLDRATDTLRRLNVGALDRKALDATLFDHRMVEVARALAADARLLLLDEPLAGLSPHQREIILGAVEQEVRGGTSVLIIEHLIPTIAPVVDRMVVLVGGTVVADGEPGDVLVDPTVVHSYLGQPVG